MLGIAIFCGLGPKDLLLMRQALSGRIVWRIVLIFAGADALLIALGVAGIGALLHRSPAAARAMLLGGAIYLFWFGCRRLMACIRNESMPRDLEAAGENIWPSAVLIGFANPHAWLDTVLLIGSITAARGEGAMLFAVGAMSASFVWFAVLAAVSMRLTRVFRSPLAWRCLDAVIVLAVAYPAAWLVTQVLGAK